MGRAADCSSCHPERSEGSTRSDFSSLPADRVAVPIAGPATYFVYILTNRTRTLYVGATNDLMRRVYEHRSGEISGFTSKYKIHRLVYFEQFADIRQAIAREKEIKGWLRRRKIQFIKPFNPGGKVSA